MNPLLYTKKLLQLTVEISRENFIKAAIIRNALKCACDMHSYDIHTLTANFSSYPAGYQLLKRPYLNL